MLNVAEKNSVAKAVATILSDGRYQQGQSWWAAACRGTTSSRCALLFSLLAACVCPDPRCTFCPPALPRRLQLALQPGLSVPVQPHP